MWFISKCSLTPLETSDHSNLPKNKARGHVMWAVDTEAPKTASLIDPGHRFHFKASFLSEMYTGHNLYPY